MKHVENSKAGSKPQQGQKLEDVERGRDRQDHTLATISETKEEGDEGKVTLGHWSASRNASDKA